MLNLKNSIMALKDALKSLNEAVKDLTSLHVQTFTGSLKVDIDKSNGFDELKKLIETQSASGEVKLVAESLVKFDGDSYNFITSDIQNAPPQALDIHQNAVTSGLNNRLALLELFQDLIK